MDSLASARWVFCVGLLLGLGSSSGMAQPERCPVSLDPIAGTSMSLGQLVNIQMGATGGSAPYTFAVSLGQLPTGVQLSSAGLLSGVTLYEGPFVVQIEATDSTGCVGSRFYNFLVRPGDDYLVGMGHAAANSNRVRVFVHYFAGSQWPIEFEAYGASAWGTNVATGDVNGRVYHEILTGPGPGAVYGPHVRGFSRGGTPLNLSFFAYGTLKYGVEVSAQDVVGNQNHEILTGAGPGAVFGPQVRGFQFLDPATVPVSGLNFFAYQTLRFGVNVAAGQLDADAWGEWATGPGPGPTFAPVVRGWQFDDVALARLSAFDFQAFPVSGWGSVVAVGDPDGDDRDEIMASRGPGSSLTAEVRGFSYDTGSIMAISGLSFTPFSTVYGANVGLGDVRREGRELVIAASGPDPAAATSVAPYRFAGQNLSPVLGGFTAFPWAASGANVAAGGLGRYPVPLGPGAISE